MNLRNYQIDAGRTECDQVYSLERFNEEGYSLPAEVRNAQLGNFNDPRLIPVRVNHACIGMAAEAGELLTLVQKWLYYGKPPDVTQFRKELGDVLWYAAELANALGFWLDDVAAENIAKLKVRYPDKAWTQHDALNRDTAAEDEAGTKP